MNFDEVLNRIGGFGRFQKTLYVWICLPQIFLAFHMLVSVFTGAVPPHLCRSTWPPGDGGGPTLGFNLSIAPGESCTSVQDGPLSQLNHSLPITEHSSASNGCTGGWEFSKEVFLSTIVTEVSANLKTSQLYNRMWLFCDVTCTALLFLVLSELVMHCGLDVLGADCIENFWPPVVKASQTASLKWCSSQDCKTDRWNCISFATCDQRDGLLTAGHPGRTCFDLQRLDLGPTSQRGLTI